RARVRRCADPGADRELRSRARSRTMTTSPMATTFTRFSSPVGELVLAATDAGITGVYFPISRHGPAPLERKDWVEDDGRGPASALLAQARRQLEESLTGARPSLDPSARAAGPRFQRPV